MLNELLRLIAWIFEWPICLLLRLCAVIGCYVSYITVFYKSFNCRPVVDKEYITTEPKGYSFLEFNSFEQYHYKPVPSPKYGSYVSRRTIEAKAPSNLILILAYELQSLLPPQ